MRVAAFLLGLLLAILLFAVDVRVRAPMTRTPGQGLITQTDSGIAQRMRDERTVVRPVRGDLRFHVQNFEWVDPQHPTFVKAVEARGRLDTRAAGRGDIVVRGVSIDGGDVYVEQNQALEWNYRRALNRLIAGRDTTGPSRSFIALDVAIQNARVRVKTPVRSFGFDNLSAQITRADFTGPELDAPRVAVSRATALLLARDSTYPIAMENAKFIFPEGEADFDIGTVRTGETRIANLVGRWGGDLPGFGLLASGRVENMRFQDVRFMGPRVPRSGTASFAFRMQPVSELLTEFALSDAKMESAGSNITGSATVLMGDSTMSLEAIDARFDPLNLALIEQVMGDTLPYKGIVAGTARGTNGMVSFDVTTRLTSASSSEPLITKVSGTGRFASNNFEIRRLETELRDVPLASLRAVFPGLPLKGAINGRILVTSPPGRSPLNITARIELGTGAAIVQGQVDLTKNVPTYDLEGRLLAVNLQPLIQFDVPPVAVTAHFSAIGAGFNPDIANARLHIEGRFTGWRTSAHDTIHVAARLNNGTLTVDSAAVKLATLSANATGNWHFVAPASGSITYRAAFDPITPFGPYVPFIGNDDAAGSLALSGTVNGARGQIRVAGDINGSALKVGDWGASSLESKYTATIGSGLPQIVFDASARDLRTPTAGAYANATANIRLAQPTFGVNVRATRPGSDAGLEIVADGTIPASGGRQLILQRARIDLGENNWSLVRPATFAWGQPVSELSVRGFEMRQSGGKGLARIDGRLLPLSNADFKMETVALPVGDIQRLLGRAPRISGALTNTTTVRVVNGIPQLTLTFQLDSAVIENVLFSQLTGDASFAAQKFTANATAIVDTAGVLRLHADLPMDVQLGEGTKPKLLNTGPVRITLVSDSISLAPLAALAPTMLDKVKGSLSANVVVTGTMQAPVLNGNISIRNGAARVLALNQNYDSINALIELQNRQAIIRDFIARAGGVMRLGGTVEFDDLTKPVLDVTALFAQLQAVGVDNQTDASFTGEVLLRGPMRDAVLTGALRMEDGFFPVPQTNNRALDAELAQFETVTPTPAAAPAPFFSGLVIDDLRLTVGPNLWFSMIDARAELAGELTIDKHGEDTRITGDLEGERGTYVLRAGPIIRRFDVVHATVRFRGEREINPALDITARRRIIAEAGRELNIDVHVGGTMQSPTLSLASQEAVAIPQSELLSFLLFGQPSFALGGATSNAGDQVLRETLFTGASEFASMELEQTLLDQLGMSFDIFQIRLGGSRLNTLQPSLVVGREVTRNVFLTVESGVTQLFGGTERALPTYAIHIEWRVNENTTVQISREPVNIGYLRGYALSSPVITRAAQKYQQTVEIRKRWLW